MGVWIQEVFGIDMQFCRSEGSSYLILVFSVWLPQQSLEDFKMAEVGIYRKGNLSM